jgi:hypothetical protein
VFTSSKRKQRKKLDLSRPIEQPRIPLAILLRMFLLGSVAVSASAYAIYRHYYVPRPSMLAPVTAPEPSSSDLLPAPELVPVAPAPPPSR